MLWQTVLTNNANDPDGHMFVAVVSTFDLYTQRVSNSQLC